MKTNKVGCKVSGDVCLKHESPLECRHGCEEAIEHKCKYKEIEEKQPSPCKEECVCDEKLERSRPFGWYVEDQKDNGIYKVKKIGKWDDEKPSKEECKDNNTEQLKKEIQNIVNARDETVYHRELLNTKIKEIIDKAYNKGKEDAMNKCPECQNFID